MSRKLSVLPLDGGPEGALLRAQGYAAGPRRRHAQAHQVIHVFLTSWLGICLGTEVRLYADETLDTFQPDI